MKSEERYEELRREEPDKAATAAEASRLKEIAAVEQQQQTAVGISQYNPIELAVLGDPERHEKKWTLPEFGKQCHEAHLYDLRRLAG